MSIGGCVFISNRHVLVGAEVEADGELVLRTDTLRTGHSGSSQPDPGGKSPPAAGGRHSQGISSSFPFRTLFHVTPAHAVG